MSSPVAEIPTCHKSMTIKPVTTTLPSARAGLVRARSSTVTMLPPRIAHWQDSHNYHAHIQQVYQPMHIPGIPPIALGPVLRATPMMAPTAWFPVSPPPLHSARPVVSPGFVHAAPMSTLWHMSVGEVWSTPTSPRSATETVRILKQLGLTIVLEDLDNMQPHGGRTAAVLRCRTNEVVDGATGTIVQKHVHFQVEFSVSSTQVGGFGSPTVATGSNTGTGAGTSVSAGVGTLAIGVSTSPTGTGMSTSLISPRHAVLGKQAMAVGHACTIVPVQEKGSLLAFGAVCRWLREEWTLDALQTRSPPGTGPGGQGNPLEQQQQHQGSGLPTRFRL